MLYDGMGWLREKVDESRSVTATYSDWTIGEVLKYFCKDHPEINSQECLSSNL